MLAEKISERREKRLSELKKLAMAEAEKLAHDLRQGFDFDEMYLYGSLIYGTFGFHSDIDFVIKGLKLEDFFKAHAYLLKHSTFSIDLKPWEEMDESHKDKINKQGIRL
jgi:predicted nucleotidyltransferase